MVATEFFNMFIRGFIPAGLNIVGGDFFSRLPLNVPIFVEGDSNTGFSYDTLNWSKTAIQYSGPRVWLPPGAHTANPGSTVAYSSSSNSMVDRQATMEALLGSHSGPKIFMYSIGTNSEYGQTSSFDAMTELSTYLTAIRAVDPGNITVICILPLYNTDLGNQARIDSQGVWANASDLVDYVIDAKTLGLGNMGRPQTHYDDDQHFAIGTAVANQINAIVSVGFPYDAHEAPFYEGSMASFIAKSGTGYTGNFPTNWTPARTAGDGTVTGSETTVNGYPALRLSMTAGASDTTFRVRRTVTHTLDSGDIMDAYATIDFESYTATAVPYLGILAGNGSWPNSLTAGLDVNPNDWGGPLVYRAYTTALASGITETNFDVMVTIEAGETAVITLSRPAIAEVGNSSAVAPVALTAPVMASLNEGDALDHVAGTYSGTPVPDITYSYYVNLEAVANDFAIVEGDIVEVRETAQNIGGSANQTSASITVGAAVTALASWDSAVNFGDPAELAYTDNDRVVTATPDISSGRHTRGPSDQLLSGAVYFEMEITGGGNGAGIGTGAVTALSGGTFGVVRTVWLGTTLFRTGGNTPMGSVLADGDILRVMVDVDNSLIWMSRNDTDVWNNVLQEDITLVGATNGASISGMNLSDLRAYANISNTIGDAVTLHGTADRFTYTAPTGTSPLVS